MPTKISCQTEVSPAFQEMSEAERPKNCHDAGLRGQSGVRAVIFWACLVPGAEDSWRCGWVSGTRVAYPDQNCVTGSEVPFRFWRLGAVLGEGTVGRGRRPADHDQEDVEDEERDGDVVVDGGLGRVWP